MSDRRNQDGQVPPNAIDAECAVISSALLSAEALDDAKAIIQVPDYFYDPRNLLIWKAIVEIDESGVKPDTITVAANLRAQGRLEQAGGAAYLAEVVDATPAVGNVGHHAALVEDAWLQRTVLQLSRQHIIESYDQVNPRQWAADAGDQIHEVIPPQHTDVGTAIRDVVLRVIESIQARAHGKPNGEAVPTGIRDLDEKLCGGLYRQGLYLAAGRPGMGKAQPIGAKVLTPNGWAYMGNLHVGDMVIGADGQPTRVTGIYERGRLPIYRVTMSDGWSTECCDEHLWHTRTRTDRRGRLPGAVRPLSEIRKTLERCASGGLNHSIDFVAPVAFTPGASLPLDPYLLGIYLGDGCGVSLSAVISNPEPDIQAAVAALVPPGDMARVVDDGITIRISRIDRTKTKPSATKSALRAMGLHGSKAEHKFIPGAYQLASVQDRIRLLQGLCDSDGYVTYPGKSIEFCTASEAMRDGVLDLVGGLGGYATWSEKLGVYTLGGKRKTTRISYRMILAFPRGDVVPVSSVKHLAKWDTGQHRIAERYIKTVEPAGHKICRCIAVESSDHLYVTDGYILTHNTSLGLGICHSVASELGQFAVFLGLEMPPEQVVARQLSAVSGVPVYRVIGAKLDAGEMGTITTAASMVSKLPIGVDDCAGQTVGQLRTTLRRRLRKLRAIHGDKMRLGVVAVDYLQIIRAIYKQGRSRDQELGEILTALRLMAKEFDCPVLCLAQLKRDAEKNNNGRPTMADIRECGAAEQDAYGIMTIFRDDYYTKEASQEPGIAEIDMAKQRNGPTGVVKLQWVKETTSFRNLDKTGFDSYEFGPLDYGGSDG